MLTPCLRSGVVEAGCDEAGRGCLAGPVFAAAVVLPPDFRNDELNDSKQLTDTQRRRLRTLIEHDALACAVALASAQEIDSLNILRASILAMHRAIDALTLRPEHLLIDGNRFSPYPGIPHTTVVKGDSTYMAIAAASVLAKTYRDDYMIALHADFPAYDWAHNKGYPTPKHCAALLEYGPTPHHRRTFHVPGCDRQLSFDF